MELHLVGGFLGSGKTTAIIHAARLLTGKGQRVGIITNEQGKHLVDTGFIQSAGLPALEVTGGCICCHLDDFEQRIEEITERFDPQVIFAESVGSCTDLVATVIKPLVDTRKTSTKPASLSVFVDSRLLSRYLRGQDLPFSEGVIYIFEKQIEETGLLVINKIDLLSPADADEVIRLAKARYADKIIRQQNSLVENEVKEWLRLVQSQAGVLPQISLDLDYDVYASGEGKFAWLDREISFDNGISGRLTAELIMKIISSFSTPQFHIAHLKFLVRTGGQTIKISVTSLDDPALNDQIEQVKALGSNSTLVLINAMVEGDLPALEGLLDNIIKQFGEEHRIKFMETARYNRVPGYPQPTMRIGN